MVTYVGYTNLNGLARCSIIASIRVIFIFYNTTVSDYELKSPYSSTSITSKVVFPSVTVNEFLFRQRYQFSSCDLVYTFHCSSRRKSPTTSYIYQPSISTAITIYNQTMLKVKIIYTTVSLSFDSWNNCSSLPPINFIR